MAEAQPDFEYIPEADAVICWREFREAYAEAQRIPLETRKLMYLIQEEPKSMEVNSLLGKDGE